MTTARATYLDVASQEPDRLLEMLDGEIREKELVSLPHNRRMRRVARMLNRQLSPDEYEIASNDARLARVDKSYFIPDVAVLPLALVERREREGGPLEVYPEALPLVVEVWSPSTGEFDAQVKIAEYQQRADEEIWLLHHRDRVIIASVRQPDGSYQSRTYGDGDIIRPTVLPNVEIVVTEIFGG